MPGQELRVGAFGGVGGLDSHLLAVEAVVGFFIEPFFADLRADFHVEPKVTVMIPRSNRLWKSDLSSSKKLFQIIRDRSCVCGCCLFPKSPTILNRM